MTFTEGLHYITIGNPISKAVIGTTSSLFTNSGSATRNASTVKSATAATTKAVSSIMPPLWKLAGRHYYFVRLAGLSGAAAVVLGAVGSHTIIAQDKGESKVIFDTANRFHFFHSLALLGMPLTKYPMMSGFLMATGMTLFSGVLYYRAFTGEKRFARLAPIGGTCLIIAWLSLLL